MKAKTTSGVRSGARAKQRPSFFKLAHHRHTGRRLAHHHTSYGALFLILVLVGSLMLGISRPALASPGPQSDQIKITALINTNPPVITSPPDNSHFSTSVITVSGTCNSGFMVVIFRNDSVAGAALCQDDGQFNLQITLAPGSNTITAQHYRPGPVSAASNPINLFYDVPPVNAPSLPPVSPPSHGPVNAAAGLIITSDTAFQGVEVGKEVSWSVTIAGGQPPYAISWDWQDGTNDLLLWPTAGTYTNKHTYHKPGPYQFVIRAKDAAGQQASLQLVIIASNPGTLQGGFSLFGSSSVPPHFSLLWFFYLLLVLLVTTFWAGERYEFWFLRQHKSALRRG